MQSGGPSPARCSRLRLRAAVTTVAIFVLAGPRQIAVNGQSVGSALAVRVDVAATCLIDSGLNSGRPMTARQATAVVLTLTCTRDTATIRFPADTLVRVVGRHAQSPPLRDARESTTVNGTRLIRIDF